MKEPIKHTNLPEFVEYHRQPTKAEINFGYGATHYKSFPVSEVLKPNGRLKKWIRVNMMVYVITDKKRLKSPYIKYLNY